MPNKFGQTVNSNSGRSILRNGSHQRKEEVSTRDLNQAKDLFDKPPKARKNTNDLAYHPAPSLPHGRDGAHSSIFVILLFGLIELPLNYEINKCLQLKRFKHFGLHSQQVKRKHKLVNPFC